MEKIKLFDEYMETKNIVNEDFKESTFESDKLNLKKDLVKLIMRYNGFSKSVSPKNWRTTGNHITELKKMLNEIDNLNEISEEEKNNDVIKKQLED